MGRDCASERVSITLAEGPTRGPRLRAPHSPPRLARKRPRPGRLASPPTWKAQKAALGHRPAERASCERQRPGGSTVVRLTSRHRDVVQRLPSLSWPNRIPSRLHSVDVAPLGDEQVVKLCHCEQVSMSATKGSAPWTSTAARMMMMARIGQALRMGMARFCTHSRAIRCASAF
jgi:hypothetical protein